MKRFAGWFERSRTQRISRRLLHENLQQFRGSILVHRRQSCRSVVRPRHPECFALGSVYWGRASDANAMARVALLTRAVFTSTNSPGGRITAPPQWVGAYPREIGGSSRPLSGSLDRTESPREPISCEHVSRRCGPLLEKGWARPMRYRESALRRSTDGDDREGTGGAETPGR